MGLRLSPYSSPILVKLKRSNINETTSTKLLLINDNQSYAEISEFLGCVMKALVRNQGLKPVGHSVSGV
jgi:hypothetical protein